MMLQTSSIVGSVGLSLVGWLAGDGCQEQLTRNSLIIPSLLSLVPSILLEYVYASSCC